MLTLQPIGFSAPQAKLARRLVQNKTVEDYFIIEGLWAYEKLMLMGIPIELALVCPELMTPQEQAMAQSLCGQAREAYQISAKVCRGITDRDGAEGSFLICRYPYHTLADIPLDEHNLIVILDGLEKPGNIGTIIRSVEGAGGQAVVSVNSKVPLTSHRLIKASMGGSLTLPVMTAQMDEMLDYLREQGYRVVLTDLTAARPYYDVDYHGRVAIVAGNEIHGISQRWRDLTDTPVAPVIIPMFGRCDSLNVGFATTMVTYQASLQQRGLIPRP